MNVPTDLKYAASHEWSRIEGEMATVGITDHAQKELTDVVFVELPKVGQKVTAGAQCAVVESVKAASDIYAPLSGEVVAINENVVHQPALVNTDPYGQGWFFKLKLNAPDEVTKLKDATLYAQQIGG